MKRTKIVATLGPASDAPGVLDAMLVAGVDVVRLNFSHGKAADQQRRAEQVRASAMKLNLEIGIMCDLQGPKIRVARFKNKQILLQVGANFVLDAGLDNDAGDETAVGIDYKNLPQDVHAGDVLLLDDGRIVLQVQAVEQQKIITKVIEGGPLSNNKGINRQGGGLTAGALTDKDREDLKIAAALGADYVAISFVRSPEDVHETRRLLAAENSLASIVSKIERAEALQNLDAIISASDAVMVARGDLGVEIGDAELIGWQKRIINRSRALNRAVITATQMMESMIENAIPTRAEVFDVANAVLDGTDAVMLSAETATGKHPLKVVQAMTRICVGAEKERLMQVSNHRFDTQFERVDEAIAMATMYTANHMEVKAICALTESGATPLMMSRIRSGIPIYALSRHAATRRKMSLYRGVYPVDFDVTKHSRDALNRSAVAELEQRGMVVPGDLIVLAKGDFLGVHGGVNSLKIVRVGAVI